MGSKLNTYDIDPTLPLVAPKSALPNKVGPGGVMGILAIPFFENFANCYSEGAFENLPFGIGESFKYPETSELYTTA